MTNYGSDSPPRCPHLWPRPSESYQSQSEVGAAGRTLHVAGHTTSLTQTTSHTPYGHPHQSLVLLSHLTCPSCAWSSLDWARTQPGRCIHSNYECLLSIFCHESPACFKSWLKRRIFQWAFGPHLHTLANWKFSWMSCFIHLNSLWGTFSIKLLSSARKRCRLSFQKSYFLSCSNSLKSSKRWCSVREDSALESGTSLCFPLGSRRIRFHQY